MRKIILILFSIVLLSCKKDLDDSVVVNSSENLEIEDFIYKAMNQVYFWQQETDDLDDNKFSNNKDYTNYLQSFDGPFDI